MSDLTLVIGNYEGLGFLEGCIESARGQTLPAAEIVVVDGNSSDGSRDLAAKLGARVLHVENRGLAFLYNRGAETAATEYVLLANTDVVFDPRCFEVLLAALQRDPAAFAADPRQLDWHGRHEVHAHTTLRRGALVRELFPGFHLDHVSNAQAQQATVSAHGAAMLVRRSMFEALGGLDETFFLDFEDLDLCWRAWQRGWGSVYTPEAFLRHHVAGMTRAAVVPRRLASSHHNILRFALKCLPARAAATVIAGELLRLPRHPRVISPALLAVLRELPEILRLRARIRPSSELLAWMLAGQPGSAPTVGTASTSR
jgi:N-acetylglucosaminyl-diphospho-decaprenol L-rhamnosyltransferase